jgi:hypothetical protein
MNTHPVDVAHLDEVVSGTDRPQLWAPARHGPRAHLGRIRPLQSATALDPLEVARGPESFIDRPARSPGEHRTDLSLAQLEARRAGPDPGRNVALDLVQEIGRARLQIADREIGPEQPDSAVDVVSDPARADHAALFRIERRHTTDREAVAPVDIGHPDRPPDDPGQTGDVGDLS